MLETLQGYIYIYMWLGLCRRVFECNVFSVCERSKHSGSTFMATLRKDQKVPPKAQKKDDSDSDVPRRPAPGGFDRLEPSRSRDPKGKGDGFGFGKLS